MPRTRPIVAAAVGAMALIGASLGVPASAATIESDPKKIPLSDAEAHAQTVEGIREAFPDQSVADIEQDLATGEALAGLREDLEKRFPSTFSYIEIVRGDVKPDAIIHLAAPEVGLADVLSARKADLVVAVDQKLTAAQIPLANDAADTVLKAIPGMRERVIGYDFEKNEIKISYGPREGLDAAALAQSIPVAVTSALAAAGLPTVPVSVGVDAGLADSEELISGGTSLGVADGQYAGQLACTFSFTGTRAGKVGALTARHCMSEAQGRWTALTYENRYSLTPDAIASRLDGDAQFHYKDGESISSQFVSNKNSDGSLLTTTLRSTRAPNPNEYVCGYGGFTQKRVCANIAGYDDKKYDSVGTQYENLVKTTRHPSDGGDSGGPWFSGTVGFGVHHGGTGGVETGNMWFSPIIDVAPSAGVTLKMN